MHIYNAHPLYTYIHVFTRIQDFVYTLTLWYIHIHIHSLIRSYIWSYIHIPFSLRQHKLALSAQRSHCSQSKQTFWSLSSVLLLSSANLAGDLQDKKALNQQFPGNKSKLKRRHKLRRRSRIWKYVVEVRRVASVQI